MTRGLLDMHQMPGLPAEFRRPGRLALLAGLAGLAGCLLVWFLLAIRGDHWAQAAAAFYKAYLFAWLFWLGMSLGAMAAVMVHHQTGGNWGVFVRRFGENAAAVLPLLFVLFIPILIGLGRIYPWADPHNHDPVIRHKHFYLNVPFFILRYVIYFVVWSGVAWALRALSVRHDRRPSVESRRLMRGISSFGLVAYFITMSLAAVDWIMSMEPNWYSTVFGFIVLMGQAITGVCALIILLVLLRGTTPFVERLRPKHFNDLGNLLMTCVILWAYNDFAQLLIIWMGNTQVDIGWYVKRTQGAWKFIGALLIFLGFLTPFALLLLRDIKMRARAMLWLCVGLLIMRLLDLYWMVMPGGTEPFPAIHWLGAIVGIIAVVGIGGLWIGAFLWLTGGVPLMVEGLSVPIETEPGDELSPEHRVSEHGTEPGTQPGLA